MAEEELKTKTDRATKLAARKKPDTGARAVFEIPGTPKKKRRKKTKKKTTKIRNASLHKQQALNG